MRQEITFTTPNGKSVLGMVWVGERPPMLRAGRSNFEQTAHYPKGYRQRADEDDEDLTKKVKHDRQRRTIKAQRQAVWGERRS